MVDMERFQGTPMFNALMDLAFEIRDQNLPPVELNVIGGFALMLQGVRPATDITDIDYFGPDLSKDINELCHKVGMKHGMESGWINNDGMLAGDSMDDFELSTGPMHFETAFVIGPVTVNVLDEKDLLRLKVIAVDTAMTELEATGDFARRKDFGDIKALMDKLGMGPEDVETEFEDYILCEPDTNDLISIIYEDGPEKAMTAIDRKARDIRDNQDTDQTRSPYMENLLSQLMGKQDRIRLQESDLDFAKDTGHWEL